MPVKQSFTVKATDVRQGDFVQGYGAVLTHVHKTKWTYLGFAPRVTTPDLEEELRIQNDAEVTVVREVETEEEAAAKALRRSLQALDWKERSARNELASSRNKMIEKLQAGERASHWSWMDVPLAEAVVELWEAVANVHRQHAVHGEPITRLDAVRLVRGTRMKKAVAYFSATSRSSGVISNLFEDIERQALSYWVRELEWVIED